MTLDHQTPAFLVNWPCSNHHRSLSSSETAVCWQSSVSQLEFVSVSCVVCKLVSLIRRSSVSQALLLNKSRQSRFQMSNPVIHQPGAGGYGTNVQTGDWSTGLCSCCSDCLVCAIGFVCPFALSCYTANKYGENCCLACLPGGMTAMRTHMRLTYGIQGTICNDALMTCFCGPFEICRMAREIRIRNGDISL